MKFIDDAISIPPPPLPPRLVVGTVVGPGLPPPPPPPPAARTNVVLGYDAVGKYNSVWPPVVPGLPTFGVPVGGSPEEVAPAPPLPKDFNNEKLVDKWKEDYKKWSDENSHLPGLQTSEQIIERFKAQVEARKKQQQNPNTRITVIEQKLDKLMNHLGVK